MIDVNGMCFQLFLRKLPPVPEMRPKVVNFTQELVAGFNRIKWQLLQELMAGLIKNIQLSQFWHFPWHTPAFAISQPAV